MADDETFNSTSPTPSLTSSAGQAAGAVTALHKLKVVVNTFGIVDWAIALEGKVYPDDAFTKNGGDWVRDFPTFPVENGILHARLMAYGTLQAAATASITCDTVALVPNLNLTIEKGSFNALAQDYPL